jgi:hypothetical protein
VGPHIVQHPHQHRVRFFLDNRLPVVMPVVSWCELAQGTGHRASTHQPATTATRTGGGGDQQHVQRALPAIVTLSATVTLAQAEWNPYVQRCQWWASVVLLQALYNEYNNITPGHHQHHQAWQPRGTEGA